MPENNAILLYAKSDPELKETDLEKALRIVDRLTEEERAELPEKWKELRDDH